MALSLLRKQLRYKGKERPIHCEGRETITVKLSGIWRCARCGSVVRQVYIGTGREDLDGVHDSMTAGDFARRLRGRSRAASPAA